MKVLIGGSIIYMSASVAAAVIAFIMAYNPAKPELIYVPEPHIVREVVHDQVPVYITVTPVPTPAPTTPATESMQPIMPAVTRSVVFATQTPPAPVATVSVCQTPGNGHGKAIGWKRRNC
jgi:hypothetical protein